MLEKRRTLCLVGFTYLVAQLLAGFMPSVAFGPLTAVFVYRKPLARRVVQKKTNVDNGKRKTPFAILGVRSANCTSKQREVIQK